MKILHKIIESLLILIISIWPFYGFACSDKNLTDIKIKIEKGIDTNPKCEDLVVYYPQKAGVFDSISVHLETQLDKGDGLIVSRLAVYERLDSQQKFSLICATESALMHSTLILSYFSETKENMSSAYDIVPCNITKEFRFLDTYIHD